MQKTNKKQNKSHESTLDPICQKMLIPVGRCCSISWRIYFLCNLLHRFGVSTHFSYTCRKSQKKKNKRSKFRSNFYTAFPKALFRQILFRSFCASQCFLVPTNQSPRKLFCFFSRWQDNFCVRISYVNVFAIAISDSETVILRTYVNNDWMLKPTKCHPDLR
jgi:hypothetical protein